MSSAVAIMSDSESSKKKRFNKRVYQENDYFFGTDTSINPFNSVGLFTYIRTYARRLDESNPTSLVETWGQCVKRVVLACNDQLHCGFKHEELVELYDLLYNLKGSVAGRFLWQLGTKTVDNVGLTSLMNCAFRVIDSPIEPFTWVMEFLMCGSGCGFRLLPEDLSNFPPIQYAEITRKDTSDADFIIPDSREGWVKLLGKVLKAHFYSGKGFTYSCMLLRSKGAPIKGFGGTASGPDILCDGMEKISTLLNSREGQRLRPIDALDMMNILGYIVVAGNIRRSAEISLGSCKDKEYLRAKRWDLGNIPNTRCYSNNSVICNDINDILEDEEFWQGYNGNGEPYGLINLDLSRKCGRLGETEYCDPTVDGYNPCAEQSLANGEVCCLAELYLPNITSKDELFKVAKYLYRINKHALTLPCVSSTLTEDIVHQNMRMGIGITGYCQCTEEQKSWLSDCYAFLRDYDVYYSKRQRLPVSVKLTTVKPSGTLSLLAGCTSGVHPGYAPYYIRRIRISSEHPLVHVAREHGYNVEYVRNFDGTHDRTTLVIEFPYALPANTTFAKDSSAVEQLETVRRLQTEWSDNAVSCTIYYKKDELPEIKQWLREHYNNEVKSISFLLHSDHGFDQAPLEEITKEQYETLVAKTRPISSMEGICYYKDENETLSDCVGGACPIK